MISSEGEQWGRYNLPRLLVKSENLHPSAPCTTPRMATATFRAEAGCLVVVRLRGQEELQSFLDEVGIYPNASTRKILSSRDLTNENGDLNGM